MLFTDKYEHFPYNYVLSTGKYERFPHNYKQITHKKEQKASPNLKNKIQTIKFIQ